MPETSIIPIGPVTKTVSESYGTGDLLFRLGNGGAGATGLLKVLCEAYLEQHGHKGRIDWICNHSRNTQVALHRGYIDVAMTYELHFANLAEAEGWSRTIGLIFYDQFCLVGPLEDPANTGSATSVGDALKRIASSGSKMHARVDGSATMEKERQLWETTGMAPWKQLPEWYETSMLSPSEALIAADKAGAYLLTDRSTLLKQASQSAIFRTTCYFEPAQETDQLMNPCYALESVSTATKRAKEGRQFARWLQTKTAQNLVDVYGVDTVGIPLFASVRTAIARGSMRGGRPIAGRWAPSVRTSKL